ncbi:protein HIDE1 [Rhinatrema bivittatum]|uniref:protein HIDE1 n=1 Tax=Rhinatrema bivittatum TaxID=194408 RepID=UPI00112E8AE2|nr:protein HIDE1 [Rhinatrema bivittatum]
MSPTTPSLLHEHTGSTNSSTLSPASAAKTDPAWLVPVSVGCAAGMILILSLVTVVLAVRRVKAARRQKRREKESCWTENVDSHHIDLTFDNAVFSDPVKWQPKAVHSQDPNSDPAAFPRPFSVASPQFSTFRS